MRNEIYNELKEDIITEFYSKDNTYEYSDRLQVAVHDILDAWVSSLPYRDVLSCLEDFDDSDFRTIDKGLYDGHPNLAFVKQIANNTLKQSKGVLEERGYVMLQRVMLYCLIEQDLYNEEDFNELQFKTKVAGIRLKLRNN